VNDDLLRRAASAARPPRLPRAVDPRDAAGLGAELGRPLPGGLTHLWSVHGAGWLGRVSLWDPREIAQGVGMADRHLEEGLLPFAHGGDGELWLLDLAGGDDPDVLAAGAAPGNRRLGPLSATLELAALAALIASAPEDAPELQRRLAELQKPRPNRST